jgi:hypothetical protein
VDDDGRELGLQEVERPTEATAQQDAAKERGTIHFDVTCLSSIRW